MLPNVKRILSRMVRAWAGSGNRVSCCLCGWTGRFFLPGGAVKRTKNRKCGGCGSVERYRQLWKLIEDRGLDRSTNLVLDFSPPEYFRSRASTAFEGTYLSSDIIPGQHDLSADLTQLPVSEQAVDLVLCIHVLEHVADDLGALREIRRCLRPGGLAVIQVPIRGATTLEVTGAEPEEYESLYGQADHVRWYGLDLKERIENARLPCELVDIRALYEEHHRTTLGLGGDDRYFFLGRAPR